jgi:hypothetical protein
MLGYAAFLTLAAATPSVATDRPPPPPSVSAEATTGAFHVIQLWSDDEARFMREWQQPTPPKLTTSSRIQRNQPISLFLVFGGCQPDAKGNCDVAGTIDIIDPAGKPYGSHGDVKFWNAQPAPPAQALALSPQGMTMLIEDGEVLGDYIVRIAATDLVAKVTASTEQVITVVEAGTQ